MHLYTPKLIYQIKIKAKTSQSAECPQAPWGLFSAKLKAIANELHQQKPRQGAVKTFCSLVTATKSIKIDP